MGRVRGYIAICIVVLSFTVAMLCGKSAVAQGAWPAPRPTPHSAIEVVPLDTPYASSLSPIGDTDWYQFTIHRVGRVVIHTTGASDTLGRLEAADGSHVAQDDNSGDGANFRISVVLNDGTYFLRVSGSRASDAGSYALHVGSPASDWPAPRPSLLSSIEEISFDTRYNRSISFAGDTDWYRFSVPPGSWHVTGYTAGDDPFNNRVYRLEAADGSFVAQQVQYGGGFYGTRRILKEGTYCIRVVGEESWMTGTYGIKLERAPHDDGWPMLRPPPGWIEPLNPNTPYERAISPAGDTDWYYIFPDGEDMTILTTGDTDTLGRLENEVGGFIAQDDNGGEGNNFRIRGVFPSGISLRLRVTGARVTEEGAYTLWMGPSGGFTPPWPGPRSEAAIVALPLDQSPSLLRALGSARETDWYSITTPPGGGQLVVHTTGETDTLGRLETAAGTWLCQNDNGGAGVNFWMSRSLPEGTYYLRVTGSSVGVTGTYSVHASCAPVAAWPTARSNATVQALSSGRAHEASIRPIRDTDWYSFAVPSGGRWVSIHTEGSTDTLGRLESSGGSFIAQVDNRGPNGNFHIMQNLREGTYYLRVTGANVEISGDYALYLHDAADPSAWPTSWPPAWPALRSISAVNGLPGGQRIPQTLGPAPDTDWYVFDFHGHGSDLCRITISTTGSTDTMGRLETESGEWIAQDDNSSTGSNFLIQRDLPPGTYYLRVTGYDRHTTGNYSLLLTVRLL